MDHKTNFGVQTFGLGDALQADLEGTITKLKAMGFSSVEPLILPTEKQGKFSANLWSRELLERAAAAVKANGFSMPSAHIGSGFGPFKLPEKKLIQELRQITELYGIQYFVFSGMFRTDKAARSWGEYLRRVSDALDGTGAVIVYHNHDVEFIPIIADGRLHYPLDTFFEYAGGKVKLQLDFGWAAFAGDERELFARYREHIVSLHCKDFYDGICRSDVKRDDIPAASFAPIGAGAVKTAEIIAGYLELPNTSHCIIIDQDKCGGDRFEELQIGLDNINRFIVEAKNSLRSMPAEAAEPPRAAPPALDRSRLSLMTFSLAADLLTRKLSIEDTLRLAAETGVPAVDLLNIRAKDIPAYITAMTAAGVSVDCYIANIPFFASDSKIKEALERQMSIASALRASLFMIVPYGIPTEFKTAQRLGKTAVRERMIAGFRAAVKEGKKRGMTVCFETTPHDELALSSAEDCRYILNAVDGLKLVFDTANMLPAGETPTDYYERLKEYIVHVHLKDVLLTRGKTTFLDELAADGRKMNCCVWGEGEIPIAALYERMLRDGYNGSFAIEYARPSGVKPLKDHIKQLTDHFGSFEA